MDNESHDIKGNSAGRQCDQNDPGTSVTCRHGGDGETDGAPQKNIGNADYPHISFPRVNEV